MTNPLGLHAGFTRILPLPERLRLMRDAGFDATSLWWEEQRPEIRAIRHRAPDLVRDFGLDLDHLHVPYFACNDLWSANNADRGAAVALHKSWIADCQRHAVPRMVMHATRGRSVPAPSTNALDAFRQLAVAAEDTGVIIAVENTHSTAHLDFLLQKIESPHLTLCYDVAHDRLNSATPQNLLCDWSARVSIIHLSDTDGRRDYHWLPGDGNTDFAQLSAHFAPPYSGPLVLEAVHRGDNDDLATFVARAHAAAMATAKQITTLDSLRFIKVS